MREFNLKPVPDMIEIDIQLHNAKTGAYCFTIPKDNECENLIDEFEILENVEVSRFDTLDYRILCIVRAKYGVVALLVGLLQSSLNSDLTKLS